jgi:hypothetical protein
LHVKAAPILNRDVLYSILDYVHSPDLKSLALTSRWFATTAIQRRRYRNISFDVYISRDGKATKFDLLYRSLQQSPALRALVRSADIRIQDAGQSLIEQVLSMLLMLRNLQRVHMLVQLYTAASNLQENILMLILKSLTSLNEIKFKWRDFQSLPIMASFPKDIMNVPALHTLEINSSISLIMFQQLLCRLNSLTSLRCKIPGTPGPDDDQSMIDCLSP